MNFLDDEFDLDKGIKTVVDPTMSDAMKQHNDAIEKKKEFTKIQKAPVLNPNPKIKGTEAQKKMHLSEDLFEIVEKGQGLNECKELNEDYGWEVKPGEERALLDYLVELWGEEDVYSQIIQALDITELGKCLAFICRMNGFDNKFIVGYEEDEEDEDIESEFEEE